MDRNIADDRLMWILIYIKPQNVALSSSDGLRTLSVQFVALNSGAHLAEYLSRKQKRRFEEQCTVNDLFASQASSQAA